MNNVFGVDNFKEYLRNQISSSDLENLFAALRKNVRLDSKLYLESAALFSRYMYIRNYLNPDNRSSFVLSREDKKILRNRLAYSLLSLIDKIQEADIIDKYFAQTNNADIKDLFEQNDR